MTKQVAAAAALAAMVDELGDLEQETQPWRAKIARVEVLRAALRAAYADKDAYTMYNTSGARWTALIGICGNQSVVDRPALFKLVGSAKFIQCATISLKAIKEFCGAAVLGAVVSTAETGPRSIDVVPLIETVV